LVKRAAAARCRVRSLHEAIDPGGRLVFHIFAALAEFIRELIAEGTHEGLAGPGPAASNSADRRR
jgi:DNA invertase Pin-like site-specific DNA recombinase